MDRGDMAILKKPICFALPPTLGEGERLQLGAEGAQLGMD
jgi:hypothetical protein